MILAHKELPSDVLQPIMHMLGWLLWAVLLLCMAWLIVSAGRLWMTYRSGNMFESDPAHGVLMSIVGALVASTASGIALALLPNAG